MRLRHVLEAATNSAVRAFARAAPFVAAAAFSAEAQRTHVLIITGLGGEPQYSTAFYDAAKQVYDAAHGRWGVADSSLIYIAEDPARDPERIRGRSTRESVVDAFLALSHRVAPGDVVFVFLLGHGSGEGADSRVNLPGVDPTAAEYAALLGGFGKQTVIFVNASSASGDFARILAAPGRVIVTATKTSFERNESIFAKHFAAGITSGEADADKDGRVSVMEAFDYARREVARAYETERKLQTEHALVSDSTLAQTTSFGNMPASADPRVASLVAERRALEDEVAALRARKAQMDSTSYERELERLLLAIAEKTQAIRAAGGRQ
jgi:hypothetical protein